MDNKPTQVRISKSKFVAGVQCLKRLYWLVHEPGLAAQPDAAAKAIFEQGREVGQLARQMFPGGVEVGGSDGLGQAIRTTRELVANREVPAIFEATFEHRDVLVRVDVLQRRRAVRRRLPDERRSITHHFSIAGQEGYLTVGVYEDGSPGEIFITMSKEGSTISGLMDSFATVVSLALQYGLPLQTLCNKFSHVRFEPSGWSGNPKIGYATSIMDYLFRWLELKFLKSDQGQLFESLPTPPHTARPSNGKGMVESLGELVQLGDGPVCHICGSLMVRSGSCHRCMTCGSTSGCS